MQPDNPTPGMFRFGMIPNDRFEHPSLPYDAFSLVGMPSGMSDPTLIVGLPMGGQATFDLRRFPLRSWVPLKDERGEPIPLAIYIDGGAVAGRWLEPGAAATPMPQVMTRGSDAMPQVLTSGPSHAAPGRTGNQFAVQFGLIHVHPQADLALFINPPQLRILRRGSAPSGDWPYMQTIELLGELIGIWHLPGFPPGQWTQIVDGRSGSPLPVSLKVEGGSVYATWT